ncbi:hypothetical protein V8F06_004310 [Rhypophila decipiens]
MRVGSQQFTARRITITLSAIAVSHIWNWGWTWQDININLAYIAFACNNFGGDGAQGTGSLTILDSHFNNVPYAITVNSNAAQRPAITIENLVVEGNTPSIVLVDGGETILAGTTGGAVTIGSWAMGRRYTNIDGSGSSVTGPINPRPNKPTALLDSSGKIFTRSKPQYENHGTGSFVSVADFGAVGDGTGDQSAAINAALAGANGRIVDHDLDIVEQTRCNIFVARGLLVETTEPVWLWGGASEHAVLYQYNFHHASNIFIAHMQTESPYFQPTPDALRVWQPGAYESDTLF